MFLNIFKAEQLELCMYAYIHKTPKVDLKSQTSSLAINFDFIKKIQKLYKGKYPIRSFLRSFFTGKTNQLNALTSLIHFDCFLDKHPYRPYPKPSSPMVSEMAKMGVYQESNTIVAI